MYTNITYLEELALRMRRFVDAGGESFAVFGAHSDAIEAAYHALTANVRNGGA